MTSALSRSTGSGSGAGEGAGQSAFGGGGGSGTNERAWVNPYHGHRALSEQEAEVLGEYARLAETIKRITALSYPLSSNAKHADLLMQLRVLERKMGLVLTLFKASVWALVVEQQDRAEEEERRAAYEEQERATGRTDGRYGPGPHGQAEDETLRS
ncbi:dash complex subunit dad3 [Ceraceosorus bombacis]|uniref:DASH complex subunit DAD3 n=1 Tax=Ceraceosorus bombacis TaxID=401625 RepID=A0A0P1BEE6_9BASI|nr:dash complex subunit dad3 [Ceraceosorus bombacis]